MFCAKLCESQQTCALTLCPSMHVSECMSSTSCALSAALCKALSFSQQSRWITNLHMWRSVLASNIHMTLPGATMGNGHWCRIFASRFGQWPASKVGVQRQLCHPHPHLQLHSDPGPSQPVLHPSWRHPAGWTASAGQPCRFIFTASVRDTGLLWTLNGTPIFAHH